MNLNMSQRLGKKFNRHWILRQKDPWDVARNAFDIALEFAILGYIAEATELFSLFQTFSSRCKSHWSPGLYFAWETTGLWPDSIPAEDRTLEALKKFETERILWRRATHATEAGLDQLIALRIGNGKKDEWGYAQLKADDLAAAIDIALYLDKREKALDILQIFADNLDQTWKHLSRSRQAWRYLKHKALASIIEINEEKIMAFKDEVIETFSTRLEKGAQRLFKDVPMRDLVKVCNENTLKNADWEKMDDDLDEPPETILHEGATQEEIAALEARLGCNLPEDFREYLSLTNGMEPLWDGFYGQPKLLGTDEIRITNASKHSDEWNSSSVGLAFVTNMSVKAHYPNLERVIRVNDGADDSTFVWLVEPELAQEMSACFFSAFAQLPPEEQQQVGKLLGYFHAGKERPSLVGWVIVSWTPQELDLQSYHSWREYLEVVTSDTANTDILDEVDKKGRLLHSNEIFAYELR